MFKIIIISIHFQNELSFSNNMLMFIFMSMLYDKRKFEIDINNDVIILETILEHMKGVGRVGDIIN